MGGKSDRGGICHISKRDYSSIRSTIESASIYKTSKKSPCPPLI